MTLVPSNMFLSAKKTNKDLLDAIIGYNFIFWKKIKLPTITALFPVNVW